MAKKRGCYFLTADEEASPSKLVKFSDSVPQVPKSGDSSEMRTSSIFARR